MPSVPQRFPFLGLILPVLLPLLWPGQSAFAVGLPTPCTATSAATGLWTDPNNWTTDIDPGCPDGVYPNNDANFTWTVIIDGHEITLDDTINIDELSIRPGGELIIPSGEVALDIRGNLTLDSTGSDGICSSCDGSVPSETSLLGGNTPPILRISVVEETFASADASSTNSVVGIPGEVMNVDGDVVVLPAPTSPVTFCVNCNIPGACRRPIVRVGRSFLLEDDGNPCLAFLKCVLPRGGVLLFPEGVGPEVCPGAIPTVSTWGLLLTGLLVLTAASIVCRRPRREAA